MCMTLAAGFLPGSAPGLGPASADAKELADWASIGPLGPGMIDGFDVADSWPNDGLALASRRSNSRPSYTPGGRSWDSYLMRTRDGGQTWERLEAPAGYLGGIDISPGSSVGRVVLGWKQPAGGWKPLILMRSQDDGDTWTDVLEIPDATNVPEMRWSSAFANDGIILFVSRGRLYRSADSGRSWSLVDSFEGQWVGDVLSPSAVNPGLAYASATTFEVGGFGGRVVGDDHIHSLGLLRSLDGGETWERLPAQPGTADVPFKLVQSFQTSPDFDSDRLILTLARGPLGDTVADATGEHLNPRSAMFRSDDGGDTWLAQPDPSLNPNYGYVPTGALRWSGDLAFSPHFAQDRSLMLTVSLGTGQSAKGSCRVFRSTSAGESWQIIGSEHFPSGCSAGPFQGGSGTPVVWTCGGGGVEAGWRRSIDFGDTWTSLRAPLGGLGGCSTLRVLPDGTGLIGGALGLWAIGPGARTTSGQVACAIPTHELFASQRHDLRDFRNRLGCATSLPTVSDALWQIGNQERTIWLQEIGERGWRLMSGREPGRGSVADAKSLLSSVQNVSVETVVIQQFEGGLGISRPGPGNLQVLLIVESSLWQELAVELP